MPEPSQAGGAPDVCAFVRRTITAAANRVRVARWIGEQAVTFGRREIVTAFESGAVIVPSPPTADEPIPSDSVVPTDISAQSDPVVEPDLGVGRGVPDVAHDPAPEPPEANATEDAPDTGDEVPFDGYDTLPAAHIVQRLSRLTPAELGVVRGYETRHRARRTVVAKVDQLLDPG
jgi:hypothetical protein